jgi:hypothetical protein
MNGQASALPYSLLHLDLLNFKSFLSLDRGTNQMSELPENMDVEATTRWLDNALREHGFYEDENGEDETPDVQQDTLEDFLGSHCNSMIPARTTGTGQRMSGFDWFRCKGASVSDYLQYLNRQGIREMHKFSVANISLEGLDDRQRAAAFADLADSDTLVATINLDFPEEVDIPDEPSTPYPSSN